VQLDAAAVLSKLNVPARPVARSAPMSRLRPCHALAASD